jgi:hypothetical protein
MPQYDVNGNCEREARLMTTFSDWSAADQQLERNKERQQCVTIAQKAYNALAYGGFVSSTSGASAYPGVTLPAWDMIPAATRSTCIADTDRRVATDNAEHSDHTIEAYRYRYLSFCIADTLAEADQLAKSRKVPVFKP